MNRRRLIHALATIILLPRQVTAKTAGNDDFYAPVLPNRVFQFPADHGAHWLFRTEWWYLTAWLETQNGPIGMQLTFFRTRTRHNPDNPSRFAPKQLMFGHAAIADPAQSRALHHELAARAMPPMISATDTALKMRDEHGNWSLVRNTDDTYRGVVESEKFSYALTIKPSGAPVPQGENGYSRKGQKPEQASYYYSRPQCQLNGTLRIGKQAPRRVSGTGWLDHEWSSTLLDPNAVGWDWFGLNLDNGDALMAFRIRDRAGESVYSHASWIRNGVVQPAEQPIWQVQRVWESARTGARYPVQMAIRVGALSIVLMPLMDDQEINASRSTQTIYWEGAVRVVDKESGKPIGRGYLELTGYLGKIRL